MLMAEALLKLPEVAVRSTTGKGSFFVCGDQIFALYMCNLVLVNIMIYFGI
jgi:hypothetical protein